MDPRPEAACVPGDQRRVRLLLPRFQVGGIEPPAPLVAAPEPSAPAPLAAAPEPSAAPVPTPMPPPGPHARAAGAPHVTVHADARAHAQARARTHAQAHAHTHGSVACEGSHGLLDAHHHDWSHLALQPRSRRLLRWALYVQFAFLLLEVAGGIITNSLALLGDAAHMLADVGALGLALLAARLATMPVSSRRTWGMPRAEVVAATINCLTLVLSCAWIAWEAVHRLLDPEVIHGGGLMAIATAGLLANLLGAWFLAQADRDNVNIRAAMAHLLVDAASSVGVIIAGIVIALGGPLAIDALASLLIAFVAVRGTWPVLRASLDSLVDAAPPGVTMDDVVRVLTSSPSVTEVHDVHVWEPGPRRIAATAHVLIAPGIDVGSAILDLRGMLADQVGIDHATLQVATDRRATLHELDPRLPRDAAVERGIDIVASSRPSIARQEIRAAIEARVAHLMPEHRISPVRLAARTLHARGAATLD